MSAAICACIGLGASAGSGPFASPSPLSSASVEVIDARAATDHTLFWRALQGPRWAPPLGSPLRVVRAFSLENGPYRAGHRGVDLPATLDQLVFAPTGGEVSFVGVVVDRPVLSIRVDAQTVVSFEPISSELRLGDSVMSGNLIGTVKAGHCTTPCLHMGVRLNGNYVNPMQFLRSRAQLLPW